MDALEIVPESSNETPVELEHAPCPAWTSNKKGHLCHECPYGPKKKNRKCLLKGIHSHNARVTFVLESPNLESNNAETPLFKTDPDAGVMDRVISEVKKNLTGATLAYNVAYLIGATGKTHTKEVASHCKGYFERKMDQHRDAFARHPDFSDGGLHVLVPMGAFASKHFVRGNVAMKSMRGKQYDYDVDGYHYKVLPTLKLSHALASPSVLGLMANDIARAFRLANTGTLDPKKDIEEIARHYCIPETIEEVERVCDWIIAYTDPKKRADPDTWPISVDTETNTLTPYAPDARVIMVSFAWNDQQATAITLDHPRATYSAKEAWSHVKRVLECPKPKIFHNAKYDLQMLCESAGAHVENLWWDTMLAEHSLDESKKGFYGLKTVVDLYAPSYRGYEEKLKDALAHDQSLQELDGVPDGQDAPNPEQSWVLSAFFPLWDYEAACESAAELDHDKRFELFNLEFAYLWATDAEDKKAKQSARGRIRRRCKKWGVDIPDTVKPVDFGGEKDRGYVDIPLPVLLRYAGADADVTRIIAKKQRAGRGDSRERNDMFRVLQNLQLPMTPTLGRMEFIGTRLNLSEVDRYAEEMTEVSARTLVELQEAVCDSEFNPGSNTQLEEVVGPRKAIPVEQSDLQYTAAENLSITSGWMDLIQKDPKYRGTRVGDFFEKLMIYRGASKASSSFVNKLKKLSGIDGRIHTRFHINGTSTGRLSSAALNLQNIPQWMCRFSRQVLDEDRNLVLDENGIPQEEVLVPGWNLKKLFIPTDPDEQVFFQLDISAAEIRVLCAYAKDPSLVEALEQGLDVHSFIASNIFDPSYDEFIAGKDSDPDIKHLRTAAKRVVFGTLYGAGPRKIAAQIYGGLSTDPDEKEEQVQFAQNTINLLFRKFDRIENYVSGTHSEVARNGFVRTFFGRRRRFQMRQASFRARKAAEREAVNFKIQSTSSDLVMSQLIEVDEHFHEIGGRVLLTVHDSIAGEIQRSQVPKMVEFFDHWIIERIRQKYDWLPVPFKYDLEIGPNYGELADISSLSLLGRDPSTMSDKEAGLYKKSLPILRAAGLAPQGVQRAS